MPIMQYERAGKALRATTVSAVRNGANRAHRLFAGQWHTSRFRRRHYDRTRYPTLELPGKDPLKDAHAALGAAVLDAYGFDPKADLLAQLLELNLTVAAKIDAGQPVTAPGVPPSYGDPKSLITDDCIRP